MGAVYQARVHRWQSVRSTAPASATIRYALDTLSRTFLMGSPAREVGRRDNEEPGRGISIKSLAVGKFEVTRGQFAEFVDATRRDMAGGCSLWLHSLNPEIRNCAA